MNFSNSETAHIDSFTGTLKFSSLNESILSPIIQDNIASIEYFTNFPKNNISSDTGVSNVIVGNSNNSWNLTVKSPNVINDSIFLQAKFSSFNKNTAPFSGAEVAVKIVLRVPVLSSRIRISPNVGFGLYLTQVVIEKIENNENTNQTILTSSIYSDKNIDFDFPEITVKSFILFFKQKNYKRTKINSLQSEINSKMISYIVDSLRSERKKNHDVLQDYVINFFIKDTDKNYILKNKSIYTYDYTKYYPVSGSKKEINLLKEIRREKLPADIDAVNKFKNSDLISNMIFAIISFSIGSNLRRFNNQTYIDSNLRSTTKSIGGYASGGILPLGDSNNIANNIHYTNESYSSFSKEDAIQSMSNSEDVNMYEYMFSIKNISLFTLKSTNRPANQRSFYVSKKLPLDSRPLSVKMIAEEIDTMVSPSSLNMPRATAVEYSVSVKDNPTSELDWIPVLPWNQNNVEVELLPPDSNSNQAKLRFSPMQDSISVYKNGMILDSQNYVIAGNLIELISPDKAVYTVKYTPINSSIHKEVALFSRSLASPVLSTFSSNGQNGEYFSGLNSDKSVTLSKNAYIDRSKFVGATYNVYMGTITSSNSSFGNFDYSSYSPVKVVFSDGTTAINLTNYVLSSSQIASFPNRDGYYFIHYDNRLLFNKNITQSFRVIYQYVPDIFRYRVVLRSLDQTSKNYSLDRLLFKFSSEKENSIVNNFIRYDNLFKEKLI